MSRPSIDRGIDYIEFTTADVPASKAFFSEVFGWPFTDYGPDYTCFNDGVSRGGFAKGEAPGIGPLIVIYAKDLDAMQGRVTGAGGVLTREPFEFPGGRRFHFREPGGNELAVWSE